MTRDELIEELKKMPYNDRIQFCQKATKHNDEDWFEIDRIVSIPEPTIYLI